jgi:hypothetical protein
LNSPNWLSIGKQHMLIMLVAIQMVVGEYSKIHLTRRGVIDDPHAVFSVPESIPIRQSEIAVSKIMTAKCLPVIGRGNSRPAPVALHAPQDAHEQYPKSA